MDGLVIAFVAALAVAFAIAAGVAIARGRAIGALDEALDDAERRGGSGGARAGGGAGTGVRFEAGPADELLSDRIGRLRRRAEGAELALDQRLRDMSYLADLVGVGIVRLNDDLRVEVANTAAHVFLGREAGSMVGRTAMEALGDHRIEAIARRALNEGSSTGEVANRADESSAFIVRARRSPILGVWLVLEDVAELRRLQRIRAEFIDNLSHELRTPITTIGLLAETLSRDAEAAETAGTPVPSRMRDRIGKLEVETGNVAQMVSELLDLARIESGGRQLHLDDVDVAAVAEDSAERLRTFADRQGVTLDVEHPADLPSVRGEAAQIGQVFANLIHNAVKFSDHGTRVAIAVRREGDDIVASVRDTGIGISPTDQARIFERFYKADRARSSGSGTGLGLAIARHIVEGHGGTIRVASVEGEGSTFTFTLPIPVQAAPEPELATR